MAKEKLRVIPLGGLGEVGKNMTVYQYGKEMMIVDVGLMFPFNNMLGVDYIIPDFQYLLDKVSQVKGIVITHGHEDHIGAINHLIEQINVPIYATPLTRGLLEVKLARAGNLEKADLRTIQAGERAQIGPFQVEFFHMSHSIPDAVGLGIQTPAGLLVHSGDYKFDQTPVDGWTSDFAKLGEFSKRGVLALLADSTNADHAGWTPSEALIDGALDKVFKEAPGRVIVASFASLVSRMQQVANTTINNDRKLAFAGTSMVDNSKMAMSLGYLKIPEKNLITVEQGSHMPEKKVVIMCTGSQGEVTSIMGRLARGTNRQFDIKPKDTIIISSHAIPGNEESFYYTINALIRRGANVIYDPIEKVHVSGHANQEDMKLLINLIKPKYLIPIHGELRLLKQHAALAERMGIPRENIPVIENGQIIEFSNKKLKLAERVPGGYVFVDGTGVGDVGMPVMREREQLSQGGIVIINLLLFQNKNELRKPPVVESFGFISNSEAEGVIEPLVEQIETLVKNGRGNLKTSIEKAAKSHFFSEVRRRPWVRVFINEV
ncbi:MAG: ribonuclease J [Anaerolineaceae bacterium]|nr:ribonuclease J [Anaerolineaceae bacterium]